MRYTYKEVKLLMPHCPQCGEQLKGNGSLATPYKCSCGIWEGDWTKPGDYEIKKAALKIETTTNTGVVKSIRDEYE